MDDISFSVLGLRELNSTLDSLGPELKKKGTRFALRKAANLVRDTAAANARALDDPDTPSSIPDNIAVRFSNSRFKRTGDVMFRVGVRGGALMSGNKSTDPGLPGGGTQHWRLLEFGTHRTRAAPFLRPALEQNINAATGEFTVQLDRWIGRNLRRIQREAATK